MIHHLERAGHQSRIYLFDARKELPPEGLRCQRLIQEWFAPISAPVLHLTADMLPADAVIATSWKTAYPVRDSSCAPAKCYFVQDFEPLFVAMSSEWLFAEATYRFGFFGLTLGPWLTKICEERFGMTCRSVPIAVDHQEYYPVAGPRPSRRRLFVYMRPVTPRRGHELVTLALKRIHEAMPEVEIHVAGWELAPDSLPFPFVGHGIVSPAGLRELFSSCEVALCVSLTNYSLMPLEMAACGCPVVDIDAENTRIAYPPGAIVLAPLTPEGIAKEVLGLLQDEAYRQRQREAGLRYARSLSWEDSARLLQEALRDAVRARGEETHLRAG
jgi:glycosyltransferase involved in cell wall biosynthesis